MFKQPYLSDTSTYFRSCYCKHIGSLFLQIVKIESFSNFPHNFSLETYIRTRILLFISFRSSKIGYRAPYIFGGFYPVLPLFCDLSRSSYPLYAVCLGFFFPNMIENSTLRHQKVHKKKTVDRRIQKFQDSYVSVTYCYKKAYFMSNQCF